MDKSREEDLKRLKSVYEDKNKPEFARESAYRAYKNILRQIQDKKLVEMRQRLILASKAGDSEFAQKMTERIKEYSWRKGYTAYQG